MQVPVHPDSCKFLRFVAFGKAYQFQALCFGLLTAPQVFTRVMAPVSSILHSMGICLHRYLDDWLVQSSSREVVLSSLETVLSPCLDLDIVVNPAKSNFVPSQWVQYLGTIIDSIFQGFSFPAESREASLNRRRVPVLQAAARFLLAGSPWDSLLPLSSGSGWPLTHAVAPAVPTLLLRQSGRLCSDPVGRSLSSRSVMVAGSGASPGGGLAGPGVP